MSSFEAAVQEIQRLRHFLSTLHLKPSHFVWPVVLSLLAAFLEAVSLGLLLPTLQGVVAQDFSFIEEHRYLRLLTDLLPSFFTASDARIFSLLIGGIFLASFGKIVFRYFSGLSVSLINRVASHQLRQQLFKRYLVFGKLFFDAISHGYLNQILMVYTKRVTAPVAEAHQLLNTFFSLCVYLSLMLAISWKLTLFVLCIFPISTYYTGLIVRRLRQKSSTHIAALNELSRKIHSTLSIIPLVKAYAYEQEEERQFAVVSKHVANLEYNIARSQHLIRPLQDGIVLITILLLIAGVSVLLRSGSAEASAPFLVFFYLVMNAANTYGSFHRFQGAVAEEAGPLQEIREMFSDEGKFIIPSGVQDFSRLNQQIDFRNLHFTFPKRARVIEGLTLTIPAQKMTALVGPTGAGKTTLINLLMRYYDSPPGTILFDGVDIREFNSATLRRRIALVSQEAQLLNDSLRSNIIYGLKHVRDQELTTAVKEACLEELIGRLPEGLDTLIGDRGVMLSGGEKQRVAIARALLKQANIVILDEATSALDSKTEELVQRAITTAIQGKTAIVIAHRLSTVKNADIIAVLDRGRVIEQGTLSELLAARGTFYDYWETQKFY